MSKTETVERSVEQSKKKIADAIRQEREEEVHESPGNQLGTHLGRIQQRLDHIEKNLIL
jgi:hypothetical protein